MPNHRPPAGTPSKYTQRSIPKRTITITITNTNTNPATKDRGSSNSLATRPVNCCCSILVWDGWNGWDWRHKSAVKSVWLYDSTVAVL
ncbi:MAG TPA: hypothetical protein VIC30_00365 [Orrella sp.]